jgi:hypothetical protein
VSSRGTGQRGPSTAGLDRVRRKAEEGGVGEDVQSKAMARRGGYIEGRGREKGRFGGGEECVDIGSSQWGMIRALVDACENSRRGTRIRSVLHPLIQVDPGSTGSFLAGIGHSLRGF